jgi:glycosyltransferase involved in cell wall biosynthesis
MERGKPLVSLVVPVFNEEENVMPFYADVRRVIDPLLAEYEFEFIFTDNHSTDKTPDLLRELACALTGFPGTSGINVRF